MFLGLANECWIMFHKTTNNTRHLLVCNLLFCHIFSCSRIFIRIYSWRASIRPPHIVKNEISAWLNQLFEQTASQPVMEKGMRSIQIDNVIHTIFLMFAHSKKQIAERPSIRIPMLVRIAIR